MSGCGGSSSPEKQAAEVQSLAAEGALVAHDAAEGETTRAFTRVHAEELAKAAKSVAAKTSSRDLATLARRVEAALMALADADRAEASSLETRLERQARAAGDLAE
jgi:hypothetical protein